METGRVATHLPWNSSYARRGMRAAEDEWSAGYVVRSLLSLRCEEPLSELSCNGKPLMEQGVVYSPPHSRIPRK